ncbi:hypothetical protein TCAL_09240 [Tigriopus californicus]|uniref:Uncharacterized protein n=1 Tax=Tigriopus californicus TaxID=6832 RepID=A0A553NR71_TIGCA|nr:uncharacterized protein LOC131879715 [Tigriopus californicus]TRY67926.1 hypothetical protein TCAL_09240 [Tigriopus californicus]|eukprot:TCALIF_09240-PA protein Name:"Protein of unknown function" AED:0.00 eAED:0.00 QI:55/1/1/1/1/1/2/40/335
MLKLLILSVLGLEISALVCDPGWVQSFDRCDPGLAFLVGGSHFALDKRLGFSNTSEIFALSKTLADYPRLIDAPIMTWKDDHVLVCGGRNQGEDDPVLNECWDYWPCSNEWKVSSTPPLLTTRVGASFVTVSIQGKRYLWVLGGSESDESQSLVTTELLDFSTNQWLPGPNLAYGRFSSCALDLGEGSVMMVGGFPTYTNTEMIHLEDGSYLSQNESLNEFRWGHGCANLPDGRQLALGGLDENFLSKLSTEIYDGTKWLMGPSLPSSRSGMTVLNLDGRPTLFGGVQLSVIWHTEVLALDLDQGEWVELPEKLLEAHTSGAGTLVPNSIFDSCP